MQLLCEVVNFNMAHNANNATRLQPAASTSQHNSTAGSSSGIHWTCCMPCWQILHAARIYTMLSAGSAWSKGILCLLLFYLQMESSILKAFHAMNLGEVPEAAVFLSAAD
jgi:hypothetical protein